MLRRVLLVLWVLLVMYIRDLPQKLFAQDASTGAIRGLVADSTGTRISAAQIIITEQNTGVRRGTMTADEGIFTARMLPPGAYILKITAEGMSDLQATDVGIELGSELELKLVMLSQAQPKALRLPRMPVR